MAAKDCVSLKFANRATRFLRLPHGFDDGFSNYSSISRSSLKRTRLSLFVYLGILCIVLLFLFLKVDKGFCGLIISIEGID